MENHNIFLGKSTNSTGHVQIQQRRQAHLGGDLIVAQIQLLKFMSLNVSMKMYVCMSGCLSVCLSVCMYVCMSVNRRFPIVPLLWYLDVLFQVVDDQKTRCFGIALFCRTSAVGGLEPEDQRFCCPLTGGQTTMYMGNVYCVLTVSPFAPPTHD